MHGEGFFLQAFLYLAAAVIAVPIAKRLGLGSVLGYLLAGIVIGPFGLKLVGSEGQDVMHFAEFGVVMMLFVVGLELQPQLLWRMRGPVLGLGGAQVGVTAALIAAIGVAAGLPWQPALAVGLILALSSTAIVLQTLNEKGLMRTEGGQSSFAVLLFQDIAVIPMLAMLPLLRTGGRPVAASPGASHAGDAAAHGAAGAADAAAHGAQAAGTWLHGLPPWAETLAVLGAVAAVVIGGQFVARPFLRFVAGSRLRETFTAAALLLVIGIALLMTKVGLSPALGTFLAGVVLANSEYRHELESDIEPFKGLLLGVFFIAVGASIDFALIAARPGLIGGIVVALILVKFVILFVLGRVFRMGLDQNLLLAFALAQGGEFGFVLFSFATQAGVLTAAQAGPLVAAVALSMALTPLLMLLNERLVQPRLGTKESGDREADSIDHESAVLVAGFGDFGGTVARFLRANGIRPTVLDNDSDRVELLRRLGMKVYYGDARRRELLHAAGAEDAQILVIAVGGQERTLELVATARKHFPHLRLFARADGWFESFDLVQAGVEHVYRENADTAVRLGTDAARRLGLRAYQVHRAAHRFQRHDEEAMIDLAESWGDDKKYFSAARERVEQLEEMMLEEMAETTERDAGWDPESLRREFGGETQRNDG